MFGLTLRNKIRPRGLEDGERDSLEEPQERRKVKQKSGGLFIGNFQLEHEEDLLYLKDLTNLKGLHFFNVGPVNYKNISFISGFTNLMGLYLNTCTDLTDEALGHANKLTKLQILELDSCHCVTDDGLGRLTCLRNLTNLNLSFINIGDSTMLHVEKFTRLKSLSLTQTKITDKGLESVAQLASLITLFLSQTEVTDEGVVKNLLGLRRLSELFLTNCDNITHWGTTELRKRMTVHE